MTNKNKRIKIVVPGDYPLQIKNSSHLNRLEPIGDVVLYDNLPANKEDQIERVQEADVIINTRSSVKWSETDLRQLPKLKLIATCSIGTDMIDLAATKELGISVCNQPGRTSKVVAEHIFGLMFAVAKRTAYQTAQLKSGNWQRMENIYLHGKTIGIIGTGNIGTELAKLSKSVGMKVLAWTFNPSESKSREIGISYVGLDELLAISDVISLNVRLSKETHKLIGKREFKSMKQGAILINGGRGDLVDTDALVNSLNSNHLAGAGLDVFDTEPLPANHPILLCDQVVLTPHMADQTPEGMELLNEGAVDNVIRFLEGRPQNIV